MHARLFVYNGHLRVAATHPTTLKLAREANVPLTSTLAQLSYTSAKRLGDTGLKAMQERGRVQVGKVADLTIFDPETVAPRATYKVGENGLPPTGISYVVIGGKIAVRDSVIQDVRAGQPIRFPVEDKGRFEPINVNGWMGQHTINVPPLPAQDTTDAPAALEQTGKGAAAPPKTGSATPRAPQTNDGSMPANGTDDGKSTTGTVAGWFGDAAGPRVSDAAFCPIHGVLE
jgi:hypothetical protein